MLQDTNVERYVENAIKPLKKEITKLKLQIEELNKALSIHDVVRRSEQLPPKCLDGFDDDKFCDRSGECEWCKDVRRQLPTTCHRHTQCENLNEKQAMKEELKQKMIAVIGTHSNTLIESIAEKCAQVAVDHYKERDSALSMYSVVESVCDTCNGFGGRSAKLPLGYLRCPKCRK